MNSSYEHSNLMGKTYCLAAEQCFVKCIITIYDYVYTLIYAVSVNKQALAQQQ